MMKLSDTQKELVYGAIALVLAAGLLVLLKVSADASRDQAALHEALAVKDAEIAQQQEVIAGANAHIKITDADRDQAISDYEKLKKVTLTLQQAMHEMGTLLPPLPVPIPEPLRDAPGVIIPKENIPALRSLLIDCKENVVKLDACNKDAADAMIKIAALSKQKAALGEEKNEAVAVAKGGHKLQRFTRAMKWLGIGAAVGAAAGYAAHR